MKPKCRMIRQKKYLIYVHNKWETAKYIDKTANKYLFEIEGGKRVNVFLRNADDDVTRCPEEDYSPPLFKTVMNKIKSLFVKDQVEQINYLNEISSLYEEHRFLEARELIDSMPEKEKNKLVIIKLKKAIDEEIKKNDRD